MFFSLRKRVSCYSKNIPEQCDGVATDWCSLWQRVESGSQVLDVVAKLWGMWWLSLGCCGLVLNVVTESWMLLSSVLNVVTACILNVVAQR